MHAESNGSKKFIYSMMVVFAVAGGLSVAARAWEYFQPKKYIKNVVVSDIVPYYSTNEIHWSYNGNRIYISGEIRPVDFPIKNWDFSVKKGDTVDVVVRRSFPLFGDELDGISVEDHKKY